MRRLLTAVCRVVLAMALATCLATSLLLGAGGGDTARREQSEHFLELLAKAEQHRAAGELDAAERVFEAALTVAERFGPRTLHVARAADGLADVHRFRGSYEPAVPLYLRAISLWRSLLGPMQPRLAVSLHNLGAAYLELDRPAAARPPLEQALAIWTEIYGAESDQARNTRRALARTVREAP